MIGSVWSKWDLHVHSPLTHQNNQFKGASIEEYVDALISNDISLVGVTNYFYFAENELELIRAEIAKQGADIAVLGNIEFRITQPNKDGEWINVHCIFGEHIATEQINEALSRLEVTNTGGFHQAIYCCNASFAQNGIQPSDVTVDFDKLIQHMKKNFRFGVDYLIAVCPNGYGGFRPKSEGRSVATAIEIEKKGQLLLGSKGDREFFLKHLERYEGAVPKPVFCCSDAHGFISDPDKGRYSVGENYTWVKAKPTFEGLRQALIEPEIRVQQTDDFTENTFIKPKFTSIQLDGEIFSGQAIKFQRQTIPLNPNMVAIIGGRGTGKSLFLDSMLSVFNHQTVSNNARKVNVNSLKITLDQGDGTELVFDSMDDTYSYLHVSQGDIQNYSQEPSQLSNEIKRMLGIHGSNFDTVTANAITENIGKYRGFVQFWELSDETGNRLNTPEHQNAIKVKFTKLMATITNPQNKIHIERYQTNLKSINEKQSLINELREVQATIIRATKTINDSLHAVNQKLLAPNQVPLLITTAADDKITSNILQLEGEIVQLNADNSTIVGAFQNQGINQDISSLLDKVSEYQLAIDTADSKLQEIQSKTEQYHDYVKSRAELALKYRDYLNGEKSKVDDKFQSLKLRKQHWNEDLI